MRTKNITDEQREQHTLDTRVLGRYVRLLRQNRGLTLRTVASAVKTTHSGLSKLERGDIQNPPLRIIIAIAAYFQVPVGELLEDAITSSSRSSQADIVRPNPFERDDLSSTELRELTLYLNRLRGQINEICQEAQSAAIRSDLLLET